MPTAPDAILQLKVPLIVTIAQRRASVEEVLALGPGAIFELAKPADERLELLVNNMPVGRGEAVKVGENFGVRITSIGSPRDRAEALADGDTDDRRH